MEEKFNERKPTLKTNLAVGENQLKTRIFFKKDLRVGYVQICALQILSSTFE